MLTLSEHKDQNIAASGRETLIELEGSGKNLFIYCFSNNPNMRFEIYVDKQRLKVGSTYFATANLDPWGFTASTPGVSLLVYNAVEGNDNIFVITIPFEWEKNLTIIATNVSVATRNATISIIYKKDLPIPDVQSVRARPDPVM